MTSGARPLRGGSTTTTSGCVPCLFQAFAASPASAQMNSTFLISLSAAFSQASEIAASTISAPMARFALAGENERDCPCAAVEVEHGLRAGQSGVIQRFGVKLLRLCAIDLVE